MYINSFKLACNTVVDDEMNPMMQSVFEPISRSEVICEHTKPRLRFV